MQFGIGCGEAVGAIEGTYIAPDKGDTLLKVLAEQWLANQTFDNPRTYRWYAWIRCRHSVRRLSPSASSRQRTAARLDSTV